MNIIGMISSPRKNGNTATLVREALKGAAEQGATTQEIFLADYNIQFCTWLFRVHEHGRLPVARRFRATQTTRI